MDSYDDPDDGVEHQFSKEESELRELEARLEKFRKPQSAGNRQFARGLALVTSMGFVLAGCLIAGLLLGEWAAEQTGHKIFQLLGILMGLAAAAVSGSKLMRPFLKNDE